MTSPKYILIIIGIYVLVTLSLNEARTLSAEEVEEDGLLLTSIQGEVLKACVVTYPLFLEKIKDYAGHDNPAIQYLSYPESYEIEVYDQGNNYMIRYTKKMSQYPGLRGGDMDYVVDKTSFKVVDTRHYK